MEILSPIKNLENAKIAIKNGANALYLASPSFGARVNASITNNEIQEIINIAKSNNVKTYITFNIVVFEDELPNFFQQLDNIYVMGANGIILQDFALIDIIKKFYPDLEVHASTQMHVHNLNSVNIVKILGANRVVLPREMSFKRIKYIKNNIDIDVEIFVHGALCVSYSGQCYDSTLLDQKSANRGRCSQYCRMPQYVVHKRRNTIISKGDYPLNLKDLNNVNNVDKYKDAKINSLKIEGRLKGIDYVGLTTNAYFNAVNNFENNFDLQNVYNRTFTSGRINGINGQDLVNLNRPNNNGIKVGEVINKEVNHNKKLGYYKYILTLKVCSSIAKGDNLRFISDSNELGQEVEQLTILNNGLVQIYSNENVNIKCSVYRTRNVNLINMYKKDIHDVSIKRNIIEGSVNITTAGFTYKININDQYYDFKLTYDIDYATNKSASIGDIQSVLSKTKNTDYDISFLIELEDNLFIPNKFLKELRDNIIKNYISLTNSRRSHNTEVIKYINEYNNEQKEVDTTNIHHSDVNYYINCKTVDQLSFFENLKGPFNFNINILIEFNLALDIIKNNSDLLSSLKNKYKVFLTLPRIIYNDEESQVIECIKSFNNLCICEMGSLKYSKYVKGEIISNFTFNTTNSINKSKLESLGVNRSVLSIELNNKKINQIADNNSIVYIYGRIPIMIMDYCPINLKKTDSCGSCTKCRNNDYFIKDKLNREFPLVYEGNNRIGLYSKQVLSLFDELATIPNIKNYFLNLTFEDTNSINNIISSIEESKNNIKNSFTGNFYKETL